MKKIHLFTAIITALLFISCGNSGVPKEQTVAEDRLAELSTLEEIAYNDSIKDLSKDYIIKNEMIFSEKEENDSIYHRRPKLKQTELIGVTQEQAYLEAYRQFCESVIFYSEIFSSPQQERYGFVVLQVELLNQGWSNVVPWVDFQDRARKQSEIWNELLTKNVPASARDQYIQPIVGKGDYMQAEFWRNDSLRQEYEAVYERGTLIGINNKKSEYPVTNRRIEQVEAIKDIPLVYFLHIESEYISEKNSQKLETETKLKKLEGVTLEEAYLQAYDIFCEKYAHSSLDMDKFNDGLLFKSDQVKIYNDDLGDIDLVPLIDFPARKRKEREIWNKRMEDLSYALRKHIHDQPYMDKGKVMYREFGSKNTIPE